MHARNCGEDLGSFLAQSRIFWERATRYGVSHYEGIIRLIGLLPNKWKTWAIQISRNYINDAVNGFPRFLGEVHFCLIVYRNVPQGTYPILGNLTPTRRTLLGEPSISRYTQWRRTQNRAGDTLKTTKVVASTKSPPEKKTEEHSGKIRKRYRKDKAPMQEEGNTRDRVYVVPEKNSYEEWGARRTSGISEDRYQPGEGSRLKIYVESDSENDSEEEPEEENKEKSKENRNSPSDASTSSKYFL